MNAIEVRDLKKRFGHIEALRGMNFQVREGELYGLIGPDGAGKTTLMRIICTLVMPDAGEVRVKGLDVRQQRTKIRSLLGYMPQRFSLYPDLTVEQNLHFFAELFQVPEAERRARLEMLYHFSRLGPFKNRPAANLSGGMKQKLALSCALIHTPQVLVLDEPTFGVDPVSRQEFWEILHSVQKEGTTILVSTAYMDEADECDRVGLCFQGRIVAEDTPANLKRRFSYPLYRVRGSNLFRLQEFFRSIPTVHSIQMFGDVLHVSFTRQPRAADWQAWQTQTGGGLQEWKTEAPSIEDVFLEVLEEEK